MFKHVVVSSFLSVLYMFLFNLLIIVILTNNGRPQDRAIDLFTMLYFLITSLPYIFFAMIFIFFFVFYKFNLFFSFFKFYNYFYAFSFAYFVIIVLVLVFIFLLSLVFELFNVFFIMFYTCSMPINIFLGIVKSNSILSYLLSYFLTTLTIALQAPLHYPRFKRWYDAELAKQTKLSKPSSP